MPNNALGLTCLTDTSKTLKTVAPAFARSVRKNIRAGVQEAGAGVADAVRARAEAQGLVQATYAVVISTRFQANGASVRIQVDHNIARYARPIELGNRANFNEVDITNRLTSGKARNRREAIKQSRKALGAAAITGHALRYPVYHKVGQPGGWAVVPTRPFFFPAITESGKNIDLRMEKAIVQSARDAGFK